MARKVRAKNCERQSDGWNLDQGPFKPPQPPVPGPVTVTKRGGGGSPLENWSVTWRERERERELTQ